MENESNQIIENEKEGLGCFAITAISIFILGIIIVIIMVGIAFSNKPTSSLNDPNNDTAIINPFKEPPTLSSEQNFSSIIFNIQCNDNYSYVILRIEFFDKNKNKIKNFTLREDNMKRGELRQVEYKLSLSEIFDIKQYTYGVIECK